TAAHPRAAHPAAGTTARRSRERAAARSARPAEIRAARAEAAWPHHHREEAEEAWTTSPVPVTRRSSEVLSRPGHPRHRTDQGNPPDPHPEALERRGRAPGHVASRLRNSRRSLTS